MNNRWSFNNQEDDTWSNCDYDTKEQAILAGREYYSDDGCEIFFIGKVAEVPVLNPIDASDLVDRAAQLIDENYGCDWELGEKFYENITKDQTEDLQTMLDDVWEKWIEKYSIKSHSLTVNNIEIVNIKDGKTHE
jgi:CTP:phosphocholine cytidylyltransferase-like protein